MFKWLGQLVEGLLQLAVGIASLLLAAGLFWVACAPGEPSPCPADDIAACEPPLEEDDFLDPRYDPPYIPEEPSRDPYDPNDLGYPEEDPDREPEPEDFGE